MGSETGSDDDDDDNDDDKNDSKDQKPEVGHMEVKKSIMAPSDLGDDEMNYKPCPSCGKKKGKKVRADINENMDADEILAAQKTLRGEDGNAHWYWVHKAGFGSFV